MFVLLLALWLILAGSLSLSNLLTGVPVCALVTLFSARFLGYSPRRFYAGLKKLPQAAGYVLVLLREIFLSNLAVIRYIYGTDYPDAELVRFRTTLKSESLRVLVANSITLTPGTFTVKLEGDEYAVHALDDSFQTDIEYSAFFRRAKKLEE